MNEQKKNYEIKYDEIKKRLNQLDAKLKDENKDKVEKVVEENNKKVEKLIEEKNNTKIKKDYMYMLLLFVIPSLVSLFVISLHTTYLIRKPFNYLVLVLLVLSIILLIYKIVNKIKKRKKRKKRIKTIIFYIIVSIYIIGCSSFLFILYGPIDIFRDWLVTTAMQTMNHQYLCKWFYNDKEINKILSNNYVKESGESTDESLITKKKVITYKNEFERSILERDENAEYKIIELDVNGCKGYLAAIYDPSKVKLAVTQRLGYSGQYVTTMAKNNNAILAINGGGFSDPGNSSMGGTPTGVTISNGKLVTYGQYGTKTQSGGIIGFTNDNVLVLLKNTSSQEALNRGVRDAVTWGPFLIVNGQPSFIKGNGGWGYAARTAIGQREDGIVLFLAVNSNATRTNGADMVDLTEIMQNYGAVNAANLDGGTSTVMVLPQTEALKYRDCKEEYCYINDPIDGALQHRTRAIADAWIVVK